MRIANVCSLDIREGVILPGFRCLQCWHFLLQRPDSSQDTIGQTIMGHADTQKVVSCTLKEISMFQLNFLAIKQQETYQMETAFVED